MYDGLAAEDTTDTKNKWRKTLEIVEKDGNGIACVIMQRPIPGRNVNMCKNTTVFRGISIEAWREYSLNFLKYMADDPQFQKDNVGPPTIIEEAADKMHAIYLSRSKFGPMASDRESLVQMDCIKINEKKYMLFARSIELDKYPKDPNVVRLQYFRSQLIWEDENRDLHTVGFSNIDFGGYFPSSLMNMIMSSMIQGGKKSSLKIYRMIQDKIDKGIPFDQ